MYSRCGNLDQLTRCVPHELFALSIDIALDVVADMLMLGWMLPAVLATAVSNSPDFPFWTSGILELLIGSSETRSNFGLVRSAYAP